MTDILLTSIVILLVFDIAISILNTKSLRRLLSDFATMAGDAIDELMKEE